MRGTGIGPIGARAEEEPCCRLRPEGCDRMIEKRGEVAPRKDPEAPPGRWNASAHRFGRDPGAPRINRRVVARAVFDTKAEPRNTLDRISGWAYIAGIVEVIATDEFVAWFDALASGDAEAVEDAVGVLEAMGVALPFPRSSQIKGSRHALRELRAQSGGHPLRVFYAFDPRRNAVLLIGGDKQGDDRFYERMVPVADRIFDEYLKEPEVGK